MAELNADTTLFQRFIENHDSIEIIDSVVITKNLQYRVDIIAMRYGFDLYFLPWLYAFNDITDPTEVSIGFIFKVPDIQHFLLTMKELKIEDDDNIPGILNYTISEKQQYDVIVHKENNLYTKALPKLNLIKRKVKYDAKNGKIIF